VNPAQVDTVIAGSDYVASGPTVELVRGSLIDRYVVLGQLGAGGMGVVYAAYDPELDRKVALKLLRTGIGKGGEARTRLLREAQALAKLSHTNVVAVYDVGAVDETVWLAMEFVEGQTLSAWCNARTRSWHEVLDVLAQAGRGLEAAHRAGLVHRDFKPDNVMVSADGRVRVMDLGLARWGAEEYRVDPFVVEKLGKDSDIRPELSALAMRVTQDGAVLGTPFYMAPEQFRGTTAGVPADIFAFCVTCWEALFGELPFAGENVVDLMVNVIAGKHRTPPRGRAVPTWVRKVLGRGIQGEPGARWPSMDALLAALTRDERRSRWSWLAAGVVVVAVGTAGYGAATLQRDVAAPICQGAREELAAVWNTSRQAAVERAVRSTGVSYAERSLGTATNSLDAYNARWVSLHTTTCEAHQRGTISTQLFDLRMACLRQRRVGLAATIEVLTQTTLETVPRLIETVNGIPAVDPCEDDVRMLADVPPPADPALAIRVEDGRGSLARLAALERSGRFSEALAAILPVVAEADSSGYPPFQAEAHLLAGQLYMHLADPKNSLTHLDEALRLGVAAGVDRIAAEALAVKLYVVGTGARRPEEALALAPLAAAFVERIGDPPLAEARLHNAIGTIHHERGDAVQSMREFERALELFEEFVPDDPLRWAAANNLANALVNTGQHARARTIARAALAALERQYDPCYPSAAALRGVVAAADAAMGEFERAMADYQVAIDCFAVGYPEYALINLAELGTLHLLRGDVERTEQTLARADGLLAGVPESRSRAQEIELLRADLAVHRGDRATTRQLLVELRGKTLPETDGALRVDTRLGLLAHLEHDDAQALALLQGAQRMLAPDHANAERGLYAFTLAQVLDALAREPERVGTLVDTAIAAYGGTGVPYDGRVAEIRAWRARPRPP